MLLQNFKYCSCDVKCKFVMIILNVGKKGTGKMGTEKRAQEKRAQVKN